MNRTRNTSLDAWADVRSRLGDRQESVMTALEIAEQPLCDVELSERLGWPINRVTPRRGELVDLGLVEDAGVEKWRGRRRHFWRVARVLFPEPDIGRRSRH